MDSFARLPETALETASADLVGSSYTYIAVSKMQWLMKWFQVASHSVFYARDDFWLLDAGVPTYEVNQLIRIACIVLIYRNHFP